MASAAAAASATVEAPAAAAAAADKPSPALAPASSLSTPPSLSVLADAPNPTIATAPASASTISTTSISAAAAAAAASASTKLSRWSDSSSADANAVSEPPLKKVRNDTLINSSATSGYGEAPPGLAASYPTTEASTVTHTLIQAPTLALVPTPAPAPAPAPGIYGGALPQQPTSTGYQQSYGYGGGSFAPGSAKANSGLFYKTKLCTKFKIGACTFNERCHFAHGMEDLRKPSPGWESLITSSTTTPTPSSTVMPRPKTRPCRYFMSGNCPYGDRCNFLHGAEEAHNNNTWGGAGGSYPAASVVQAPAPTVDYNAYSNGASLSNQYANPNQAVANPSMMNPPQLIAAYGTQNEHSVTAPPNINPYATVPPVNPYPNTSQDATANYNYWNNTTTTNPPQMYIQPNQTTNNQGNQTASWMPNTYAPDGYSQSSMVPQYSQVPPQTQQSVVPTPYMQPGATFSAPYAEATYQIQQQPDYTTMYNMPGKIQ